MTENANAKKITQLDKREHDGIIYLDTPGLFDAKVQQSAANEITRGLRQGGSYQVFFVVTLMLGKVQPVDLTTIWLVLMNALEIRFFGIIINKISEEDYDSLGRNSIELQDELKECCRFLLFQDEEKLRHGGGKFIKFKQLEKFVAEVPWVDIDPDKIKDIPDDDLSFQRFQQILQIYQFPNLRANKHKCLKIIDHLRHALDLAVKFVYFLLSFYLFAFS